MKALTLTQPWATLVAIGAKRYETRSWGTKYRGLLAIHAAKGLPNQARDIQYEEPFFTALMANPNWPRELLPRGAIIAIAELTDCLHTTGSGMVTRPGLSPGRYAWRLENVRRLPEPIPAKGALGLWEWAPPEGFAP